MWWPWNMGFFVSAYKASPAELSNSVQIWAGLVPFKVKKKGGDATIVMGLGWT